MSHRPFSNNKIITYNDYNKQKKCHLKNMCKKKYIDSYSTFITLKQKCVINCRSIYPCIKAPINIIQGKYSYICNNNIPENDSCRIIKQTLYPYGYYLCKNNVCNTCVNSSASDSNTNTNTNTNTNISLVQTVNNYNLLDLFVQ